MTRLKVAFLQYNRWYFSNRLRTDTIVAWSSKMTLHEMGHFDPDGGVIRINRALRPFEPAWRITLLHEMAHLATAPEVPEHGPCWKCVMSSLYRQGAFKDLL